MNVLLVEDDAILADGLSRSLGDWGFAVTHARTGNYAMTALLTQVFDLVILDLGLPDCDGTEVLRRLRTRKSLLPVLILSARNALNDRVGGFESGADDYLAKPFELRELHARIRALIRRSQGRSNHEIAVGRLVLDTQGQRVIGDGEPLFLPAREYGVLLALMLQAGRIVSKDAIAGRLAVEGDELADNAIEVYVSRLRKRLAPFGIGIRALRGLGYLLEAADGV